ncbi:DNRLRE domain-containing protein [Microbispora rosea]|uniref:DNRLRE domain-containing protein n=1 Tax=Microbispora rosea TaxID=58117 RepID=UPI0034219C6D
MVLQLTRADGGTTPAAAKVTVDYSSFRGAGGGGFASRLTLVRLPACVLAQPLTAECAKQRTAQQRVLPVVNDVKTGHLTAEVEVAPVAGGTSPATISSTGTGGVQATPSASASAEAAAADDAAGGSAGAFVYAVAASAAATASGSLVGDFSASPLKPSGTWQAGQSGGAFTYSYPITAPPAPSGDAPQLALQYSSAAVDSLTSQTNNQSGLVGIGWDLDTGFIERSFVSCSGYAKAFGGWYNTAQEGWPDKCWQSPYGDPASSKLTLSLGGRSTDIVQDLSGKWRTVEDYGWKIEPMSSQSWWRITTQDGTVYRFGYNTDSSLTMAFIGDDEGEPCYQYYPEPGSGEDSVQQLCEKPWRWMLDREVDPNGNVIDYSYDKEWGFYCTVALGYWDSECPEYDTAVNVSEVSYGHNINVAGSSPTARIVFTTSGRASGGITDEPEFCEDSDYSDCMYGTGPRFYTSRKLTSITTQTLIPGTNGDWEDVTRWNLSYQWLDGGGWNGDEYPILWLDSIQQTGLAGGNGTKIALPPTTFEAVYLDNAVSIELDSAEFPRIYAVNNGLGGRSEVEYKQQNPCPEMAQYPPTDIWDDSGYDCYFITTSYDFINGTEYVYGEVYAKWLVKSVTNIDMVGGSPSQVTSYSYEEDPGWAIPDNPLALRDPLMPEDYTEWRGYGQVTTTVGGGSGSSGVSTTSAKFFRGLDRSVTDFDGNRVSDRIELNGRTLQEQTFDSNGENTSTRYEYKVTVTGTSPGTRDPSRVDQARKVTREKATTGWRYTDTQTLYNSDGLPDTVNDYGDTSTASDNTCTKITYARNATAWMLNYHASEEKHAGDNCTSGDLLSRTVYLYDGASDPAANTPTRGNVTETRAYSTTTHYARVKSTFDNYGRPLTTTEPSDPAEQSPKTTTTTYAPAVDWPNNGVTVTNPLGHKVTTWSSQYNGQPVGMLDANNNKVNIDYDVLGRTLQLWTPDAPKPADDDHDHSDNPPAAKIAYTVTASQPSRTTVSHLQSGAGTSTAKYTSTYTYSDGFGRQREVQTASPAGGRIVEVTTYNGRGLTERTSSPVHSDGAPGSGLVNPAWDSVPQWSKQEYDRLGRVTAQVDMKTGEQEFRRTTTNYLGADKYEEIPPVGGKTVYYTDAADQVTKIEEWLSGGGSGQQTTAAAAVAGPVAPSSASTASPATAAKTGQPAQTADPTAAPAEGVPGVKESSAQVQDMRVGASVEAKRSGKPVEVAGLTSATSSTVANPDGKTFTTTVSTRPTRVKRDGAWVPIDTSLVEKDGTLVPKAGPMVKVSNGGDGPFATVADEAGNSIALSWPASLPKPTVEGNKARYVDAGGPGADLVVTVLPGGVRHDIELRERPTTQLNYRINVKTTGWKLQQDGQGRLTLTDSAGKLVAPVAQPVMYPKPTRGEKAKNAQADFNAKADAKTKVKDRHRRTGRIATRLAAEGDRQVLELAPDASFLADPTLTYPVTVDPTVDLSLQTDTYVATWDSTGDINADDYDLNAGAGYGDVARSYLNFDTAFLSGATVTQAQLSLFNWGAPKCVSFGSGIQARRVISPWDPYTITWDGQPKATSEDAVTRRDAYDVDLCPDNGAGGITVTWNVTGIAQDWAAGQPRYGLQLGGVDESAEEDYRVYNSSEAPEDYPGEGQAPKLTVTYTLPSSPTAGNLSIAPVTGGAVSSLTPTLHATVSDTASGSLRADYEIEHDPAYTAEGTGQIWTGSSAGVTSGSDATAVVPAGKLSDGWHIRWRARATNTGTSVSSAWSAWQTTTVSVPDPLVDQLQVTPSQVLSGETVTSTLTPALAARVTTPDAGTSRVEFELEHDPADTAHGTGSIWTIGGAQAAAAKSAAAVTAPASAVNAPAVKEPPAQVQDARVGASVEAKRSGKPVEVAGLTSATSSTVANPDGKTLTTTVSTRPTRIKRDGAWVPIDTSLVENDGALVPKAGPAVTVSNGGDGPFATLADEAGNSIALSWPAPLPKPTVEGSKARYVDAAGPGADLVVTVLPGGVRHDIELRERPTTQLNYRINVKTSGWKLQQDGQGRLTLTDSAGKLVAPVAQPAMYPQLHRSGKTKDAKTGEDATSGAGTTVKANNGHRARSGRIGTRLSSDGDHQVLELTPDAAFLADPATTFPVVVDPTVNLDNQGDTYVGDWDPYSSWWDEDYLVVGSWTPGSGDIEISRGYLQFDTSALAGKSVTQAQLSLFNYAAPQCGSFGSGIQARRVTSTWDAYSITWNSQPNTTSEDAVTRRDAYSVDWCPDGNGGTITYDITAMAQDWAAGKPQYGVQLRAVDESGVGDWREYDSMEATFDGAQPPTLTATYSLPSSSPTVGNLSITPVTGGAVSSLTPTLHATVSDTASGGSLRADYEVEHDPAYTAEGTGQIWAGSSAGVTSGNDAPAVVPAGKLSNGWHVRWRARATNTGTSTPSSWSDWQTATITTVLDPVVDNVASGTQATLTVPAGKLGDGWKVRWRARAVAAGSNTSAWSGWQALTVKVPAATVSQLQITPAETVDGKTAVSSLTPQLLATVTDAYGQPLRAEFEVEHDPADTDHGTGGIWTGAVDNVASGTQASVSVPGGALSNGWGIRWRARAINTATQVTSAWSDWQSATIDAGNVPSEPGVSALQITPSQVVDDTTVATSLTPQLRAQVTNPAGGTMRAEFELEHDPAAPEGQGAGQIWTTAVDDVPAGTQATAAVPADTLTEGWLVRWRARAVAGETASAWSDWQTVRVDQPDPVLGTLQVTPSEVVDGKTVSASLTPQLLAQVTDPAGGKVRAEFELEHDPAAPEGQGTGQIWTTAVDDVTSGTQATVTVPDGKLSDGWLVRWRARAVTSGGTSAWSDWQQLTVVDGSQVLNVDAPRTQPVTDGTTNTLTPVLIAKVSTPAGGQLGAEFQVEHDPIDTAHGTGQIWTTTVNGVSSGNDAAVTVSTGTLNDGWKIRWRARAIRGAATSDWTAWQSITVHAAQHYDTTYEYDRDGRMIKQTDANGNVRTFTYDLLGRRTASRDPDTGDNQSTYDAAGHMLWSTNGKGQKVSYSYDDLGRKTAVWSGEESSGTKLAEWVYDTATNGKGELASSTRYVNGAAYVDAVTGYDPMGRPLGSSLTIPKSESLLAGTYSFATTYTLTGQVATYTMPASGGLPAETITSTYTDLDLPQAMTSDLGGGFTYVDSTTYWQTGRLKERSYGVNGKIKRTLLWDAPTGRIQRMATTTRADTSSPLVAQDEIYTYDISGEITQILDAASATGGSLSQSECFTYDGLRRLSQAWTTTAAACGSGTASADDLGIDPYAQSYTYDGAGNITSLTDGGQPATYRYPQPGSSTVRPNAVTSITRLGGTDTYAYDNAGQLTSRTVAGKIGTFAWNELGQLEKATIDGQDTTMVYDADGERLLRREPNGKTTLYLGSMEIEVNGQAVTGKRYYTTPDGATVAMRTGGDGVAWLMSGLHGSTQLAVDDTTGKVSRERYLPFGQRRGVDDLPFTDHGFLGKIEDDSTGLDYLSARYYDPSIAKFISTDPLLDLRKPQWANPYGYAGNNPIGLSDPTGLAVQVAVNRTGPCNSYLELQSSTGCQSMPKASSPCDKGITKDCVHYILDLGGLAFDAADAANAFLYALDGDWKKALISGLALVPLAGILATVYKLSKMGIRGAEEAATGSINAVAAASKNAKNELDEISAAQKDRLRDCADGCWQPPKISVDRHGNLTNGKYTLDGKKMDPHVNSQPDKSKFGFYVNSGKAVLDAAAYADKHNLWNKDGKAKVPVSNGYVGSLGRGGGRTMWINVYRTARGNRVHGAPGTAP